MKLTQKEGVVLLWVVIVASVFIIIATTMANYMVKESRFSLQIDQSSQAYSYARSGIDWALNYLQKNSPTTKIEPSFDLDTNNTGNELAVIINPNGTNCPDANYCVTSTGKFRNTIRTLEYKLKANLGTNFNNDQITISGQLPGISDNSESFAYQFDFWFGGSTPTFEQIGIKNSNESQKIYINGNGSSNGCGSGRISLNYNSQSNKVCLNYDFTTDAQRTTPYRYRMIIRYIEDTAISATLYRYEPSASAATYNKLASGILENISSELGNMNYFYGSTITDKYLYPDLSKNIIRSYSSGSTNYGYFDNFNLKKVTP